MTTLTTNDKAYIRLMIKNATYPTDDNLQYFYDNQADSDLDKTVYYALLALLADAQSKVATSNARTGDSKSSQQEFEHLERMIAYWGNKTGASLGTATIGTINLGIDEEDSEYNIT